MLLPADLLPYLVHAQLCSSSDLVWLGCRVEKDSFFESNQCRVSPVRERLACSGFLEKERSGPLSDWSSGPDAELEHL